MQQAAPFLAFLYYITNEIGLSHLSPSDQPYYTIGIYRWERRPGTMNNFVNNKGSI